MPELPTVAESGYPGFDVGSWFGLLAPAATPHTIVDAINANDFATLRVMVYIGALAFVVGQIATADAVPSTCG